MFIPDPIIKSIHEYYVGERVRMARSGFPGWNLLAWRRRVLHLAGELGQVLVDAGTTLQQLEQQS